MMECGQKIFGLRPKIKFEIICKINGMPWDSQSAMQPKTYALLEYAYNHVAVAYNRNSPPNNHLLAAGTLRCPVAPWSFSSTF